MTWTELEGAIAAGDADGCVSRLANLTEPERRTMAEAALHAYRESHRESVANIVASRKETDRARTEARRTAAFLAMLGTATLSEIKKAPAAWGRDARAYDVLAARRPAWLEDWCEWILSQGGWAWNVVRRMVREGVCARPASDMYILWMLATAHARQRLLEDPELLEYEIWELFRIEGTSELSLSGADKYGGEAWARTLLELAAEGRISRARLLDASLDALECDFHQFRAGWFSRFHEALAPTLDERASRSGRYLRLIASRIPPTVSFALKAVRILCDAARVSPVDVLGSIPPAFYAKEKGTVTLALRLAEHNLREAPQLGPAAAASAVPALEHAAAGVQDAALDFVESHRDKADTEVVERVRIAASGAAPSVRKRIVSIFGMSGGESPAPGAFVEQVNPNTGALECSTIEDLVQEFSRAIENEGPPDGLERVLDGVSRLCATRPADFERLTSPLRKRAEHFLSRYTRACFAGYAVRPAFCGLARAWLSGESPAPNIEFAPGLAGFLGARVREIAARAAVRNARPLLAAPTHAGGSIDPAALVERMEGADESDPIDLIQALLRLDRRGRMAALESARRLQGEAGQAVRYALGASEEPAVSNPAVWVAASHARDPESGHRAVEFSWHHRQLKHGENTYHYHDAKVQTDPPIPANIGVDMPVTLVYTTTGQGEAPLLRWAATVWPGHRQGWFAAGCIAIGNNLDWWTAAWEHRVFLEPLLDSGTPLGKMGPILIALGLAAKEAGEGTLAADALATAIGDGRMTTGLLGAMLARLFSWDHIKMARVTNRLAQAVRISALHGSVIRESIAAGLEESPPMQPEAAGPVLELFYELSIAAKSKPPAGKLRERLSAIKGKNRAAAMARKLLMPQT
jgi:hypothetical protein